MLMPVSIQKTDGKYRVSTPHGVKAKGTSLAKAKRQRNLLNAVEHGWHPTGARARDLSSHTDPVAKKALNCIYKR